MAKPDLTLRGDLRRWGPRLMAALERAVERMDNGAVSVLLFVDKGRIRKAQFLNSAHKGETLQ
jgi:hypothetical protein